MAKKLKCWRVVKRMKIPGEKPSQGIHFEHKTKGFHAKVSKHPIDGFSVMEYVGNRHFPATKPTWKRFKSKKAAIKEAKKYINQFC